MLGISQPGRRIKALCRWVWDHYILILMTYLPLQAGVNFAVYWDQPDYGFRPLGPGVFLTCLFPALWLVIYVGCGAIARRRRLVTDLPRHAAPAAPGPGDAEGEVSDDRRGD